MSTTNSSLGTSSAYVRVSSRGQDFAMQKSAIEAALPKGTEPVWYSERLSARTNDRPELLRLVADLRMGGSTDLWVFKLDRLCRTGVGDTFRLISELRAAKVTLRAVADGLVIRPDREDIASECYVFALGLDFVRSLSLGYWLAKLVSRSAWPTPRTRRSPRLDPCPRRGWSRASWDALRADCNRSWPACWSRSR
jgi:hypothetical protein